MPRPGDQQRPGRKRRSCDSCFVSKTSCNPPTDGTACSSSTRKGIECVNSQGTVLSRPRDDSQRDDGQPASIDDYTATQRIYYQGQPGTYFVDTQQFTAETAYNTGTRTGYNVSSGGPSVAGPNGSNYPAFPLPEQSSATFNQQTRNWYSGQPGVYEVSTTAAPALPTAHPVYNNWSVQLPPIQAHNSEDQGETRCSEQDGGHNIGRSWYPYM